MRDGSSGQYNEAAELGPPGSSMHGVEGWCFAAALVVLVDQVGEQHNPLGFNYEVTTFFNIVHGRNTGAAFSF